MNDANHVATAEPAEALFPGDTARDFRDQWDRVQASFVDQPREAVAQADELVGLAIKRLSEIFSTERARLEEAWDREGEVGTEELRQALTRYRSFFQRLLSV